MRYIVAFLFLAMAPIALAQLAPDAPLPYQIVKVPSAPAGGTLTTSTVQVLASWRQRVVYVIYPDVVKAVSMTDKSVADIVFAAGTVSVGGVNKVVACLNQDESLLAAVSVDKAGHNAIQVLDLAGGKPRTTSVANFGGWECQFGPDGTLYATSGQTGATQIVAINPTNMQTVASFTAPVGLQAQGLAVTPYGIYTTTMSTGTLGFGAVQDGQLQPIVTSFPNQQFIFSHAVVAAPNGYLFAGERNFTPQGKMRTIEIPSVGTGTTNALDGYFEIAFPDARTSWYAYGIYDAMLRGINIYSGGNIMLGFPITDVNGTTNRLVGLAAHRENDGTDTVIVLRTGGNMEFYHVAPPKAAFYAGDATETFLPGPLAAGSHFTIMGQGFTDRLGDFYQAGLTLAMKLGRVTVEINGKPCRLDFVNATQINARIPSDLPTGSYKAVVKLDGTPVAATGTPSQLPVTIVDQNESLFTGALDSAHPTDLSPLTTSLDGHLVGDPRIWDGYAALTGGDPAIFWGTGGGTTMPPNDDNEISPAALRVLANPPKIFIGGKEATLLFAGRAAGQGSEDQLNTLVPFGLTPGWNEVRVISVDGQTWVYPKGIWLK